jgi:hypothetical protein
MIGNVSSNNGILSMEIMGNGNAHGATGIFAGRYTPEDMAKRKTASSQCREYRSMSFRTGGTNRILARTSRIRTLGYIQELQRELRY